MMDRRWPVESDSVVVVFGGTGAFGRTFVKDLLSCGQEFKELRVVSRDEHKHLRLKSEVRDSRLRCIVGDVRDRDRVDDVVSGASLVIQAAALKHVHYTELHPGEALRTNVLGAENVARSCIKNRVGAAVTISTDKAVEPVNAMGMTKALAERLWNSYAEKGDTKFSVVRYGNVLNSTGSVVPFFVDFVKKQKGRLPVTHIDMTRFLLTLSDSVDLVRLASWNGASGETFVRESPACGIVQLARVVTKEVAGEVNGEYYEDVGIRPGEKLHETLVSSEEMRRCSRHEFNGEGWFYRKISAYSDEEAKLKLAQEESYRSDNCRRATDDELHELLCRAGCFEKKTE